MNVHLIFILQMQFSYVILFGSPKGPILRKFVFSSNTVEEESMSMHIGVI